MAIKKITLRDLNTEQKEAILAEYDKYIENLFPKTSDGEIDYQENDPERLFESFVDAKLKDYTTIVLKQKQLEREEKLEENQNKKLELEKLLSDQAAARELWLSTKKIRDNKDLEWKTFLRQEEARLAYQYSQRNFQMNKLIEETQKVKSALTALNNKIKLKRGY